MGIEITRGVRLELSCTKCAWTLSSVNSERLCKMASEHMIYHALTGNPHGTLAPEFESRHMAEGK